MNHEYMIEHESINVNIPPSSHAWLFATRAERSSSTLSATTVWSGKGAMYRTGCARVGVMLTRNIGGSASGIPMSIGERPIRYEGRLHGGFRCGEG